MKSKDIENKDLTPISKEEFKLTEKQNLTPVINEPINDKVNEIFYKEKTTIFSILQENNDMYDLKNASSDIKEFSLNGEKFLAKVVYVYDGDTVHCVFKLDNKMVKYNCRLIGVDCPEIAPKNINDRYLRELEVESAIKSRNYLLEFVSDQKIEDKLSKNDIKELCKKSNKLVNIKCYEFDKYGRLLIEIFNENHLDSDKSINQLMIENGYAKSYDGGKKEVFNI